MKYIYPFFVFSLLTLFAWVVFGCATPLPPNVSEHRSQGQTVYTASCDDPELFDNCKQQAAAVCKHYVITNVEQATYRHNNEPKVHTWRVIDFRCI